MTNLSRAKKWAALGLKVLACYPEDTWVDGKLHEIKTPIPINGLDDATSDQSVIDAYWEKNPQNLVGVVAGEHLNVLDIDMNSEKGKDGWYFITENDIEVPETFHVKTKNGGDHYIYRNESGMTLGPTQNLVTDKGVKLEGVDRRSGRSYFIAWSDEVPESLDQLAPTPAWMCGGRAAPTLSMFQGSVADWEKKLVDGAATSNVRAALLRIPQEDFGHAEMISRQTELVLLGTSGESGVKDALVHLKGEWLRPPYGTGKYERDWEIALAGAIRKFGGDATSPNGDGTDALETRVLHHLTEEKAKLEAKRRISAENFIGSDEMSWDDLETAHGSYLVQDLLPDDSLCFLVAKRNMGKTFAYIDMACSIAAGREWLGKTTRQCHITIVIGEGLNGYVDRIKAWSDFNGVPLEELKPWLSFIDGANLNNDISIEKIRSVAEAHKAELIIFDTWSNVSGTPNEDDAAMNAMILNTAASIQAGTALLFIHHPRKSDQDSDHPTMRGSGTLDGRAEVVMTLFQEKNYKPTSGEVQNWLALSTEMEHAGKNRGAATETIHGLFVQPYGDSAVFAHDSSTGMSKAAATVFYNLKGEMTASEFASAMGNFSISTSRRYLAAAVEEGIAYEKSGIGNIGNKYGLHKEPVVNQPDFAALSKQNEAVTKRSRKKSVK